jgi:hypothetical protein
MPFLLWGRGDMDVSLVSFTITVETDSRTFIVSQDPLIHLRRSTTGPRSAPNFFWGRNVEILNFAREPVFAQFLCSDLCDESIGTVGIDHAGLIVSYEELYVPLLKEVQNLEEK